MLVGRAVRSTALPGAAPFLPGLALLALAVAVLVGCTAGPPGGHRASSGSVTAVGMTYYHAAARRDAPALAGATLDGGRASIAAAGAGKILVLNVWASWCTPCREEFPMLAAASRSALSEGTAFLGLDERDDPARARSFVAAARSAYPQLVDPDGALLRKLTLLPQMGIPSTLVIDARGRMAARVIGPISAGQLREITARLRAGQ